MIIALSWLARYIDLPHDTKKLSELLTFAGIEVEAVTEIPALPSTVVSAHIVEAVPLPKSDHLHICKVDIGSFECTYKDEQGYLQVVCGAPNCHSGMKAIIALPGTVLHDLTIQKAKIRGVESFGMLCSERELGISENHVGIIELPADTEIGHSANTLFELPDTIFELEITPNRSDLLGYLGIARDLSAKLNVSLRMPSVQIPGKPFPAAEMPLNLINKAPDLCPRYIARTFRNVQIAGSPLWLRNALIKSGLRPINNLVDITNYVLMEYGHPLHAFDYSKLAPVPDQPEIPAIVIRKAASGESFTALDGKAYSLNGTELVIADGEKSSALAGVMGGAYSAISNDTTNIVLESAAFEPGSIRRTSYQHKISSDSSYRFERHLSDHAPENASLRAAQLICELCHAEMSEQVIDNWPSPSPVMILGIRPCRYQSLIGYELSDDRIKDYLGKLGLEFVQYGTWIPGKVFDSKQLYCHHKIQMEQGVTEFSEEPGCTHTLYFKIPPFRVDLEREADLIEELARLDGYDKVPTKSTPRQIMDWHAYRIKRYIVDYIVSRGCFETLNYSFTDPDYMLKLGYIAQSDELDMIRLKNPQSGNYSVMRSSLIPQLLNNLAYNLNHGERNVKLFELGKVYLRSEGKRKEPYRLATVFTGMQGEEHWQHKVHPVSLSYLKGVAAELHSLLGLTGLKLDGCRRPYLMPEESATLVCNGVVTGYFGKLTAAVAEKYGINLIDLKQDILLLELDLEQLVELSRNCKTEFVPIPKYPAITRDISFLINEQIPYEQLAHEIYALAPDIISEVTVFDEFHGKQIPSGMRSLSLHVKCQDQEKTLTDERIDVLIESIIKRLQTNWQIIMR